jgi:hypothetical protein
LWSYTQSQSTTQASEHAPVGRVEEADAAGPDAAVDHHLTLRALFESIREVEGSAEGQTHKHSGHACVCVCGWMWVWRPTWNASTVEIEICAGPAPPFSCEGMTWTHAHVAQPDQRHATAR